MRSNHLSYEPIKVRFLITQQTHIPMDAGLNGRKGNEGGGKLAVCLVSFEKTHEWV